MKTRTVKPEPQAKIPSAWPIVRDAAFFTALFLILLLRIDPSLIYHRQSPVFLLAFDFAAGFLNRPGGPFEWLSGLLSQALFSPPAGAALLTAMAWAVSRLTGALIRGLRPPDRFGFIHLVPAALLTGLHACYTVPLSADLGLLAVLAAAAAFVRVRPKWAPRLAACFIISLVLYYLAAGFFLLFTLLCVLIEAVHAKRPASGAVMTAAAVLIPTAARRFFILDPAGAWLSLLDFKRTDTAGAISLLLAAFFPALVLLLHPVMRRRPLLPERFRIRSPRVRFILQTAALAVLAAAAAVFPIEKSNRLLLTVDKMARFRQWERILNLASKEARPPLTVTFQANRALYHSGRLLDDLFTLPQPFGPSGLALPRKFSESAPLQESDFCWDLGSIDESRHWALEALSTDGETPWILKRLSLAHFVLGDTAAAVVCLNRMDRGLFLRGDAAAIRRMLSDSAAAAGDPAVLHGRAVIGRTGFIAFNGHPPAELDSLLRDHPDNRMALEYRVATDLLAGRLKDLPDFVRAFRALDYPRIPRHVEEALVLRWALSGEKDPPPEMRVVAPETVRRFGEFNRVLGRHRGDRAAAGADLQASFGGTYWYYAFTRQAAGRRAQAPSSENRGSR
ncbi:hypothetical protein JW777_01370 [bacterium]|nr:hypothetical protein [bacterium]